MSRIIQNITDINDIGTPSFGNVSLFAGPEGIIYTKQSTGATFAVGGNKGFEFNNLTLELELTDDNGTVTASLADIASGYFNQSLSFSQSNNVLSLVDGYSTLTASLAYYVGGFNTGMSFNTASNVLTITDGNSSISATLSSTGANSALSFNPFNNILTVTDGFGSKTASLAYLSGNTGLSFSNGLLEIQDGRGSLTASLTKYLKIGEIDYTELNNMSYDVSSPIFGLTYSNPVPANSKVKSVFGKVNQPFISASGSVDGFVFVDYMPGTTFSGNFNFFDIVNVFGPVDPFLLENTKLCSFLTQSYIYSHAIGFVIQTSSTTYSIYLSFTDGTQSAGSTINNPRNWTSGNVSFVIEYEDLNFNYLPF
jgi:hypothetical protein